MVSEIMCELEIVSDAFVWQIVSKREALLLFGMNKEVYILYPDETESLVQDVGDILDVFDDCRLAIEIGFLFDLGV